jgi:membrane-bound lytic murein transglycosylase MltF
MKDEILRFTSQELREKFPDVKFEVTDKELNEILVKVRKGKLSHSVSVRNVIQHYWTTYDPTVLKNYSFHIENNTLPNEVVVGDIYQH